MHCFQSLCYSYFFHRPCPMGYYSSFCSTCFLLCRPPNQVLFYLSLGETQLGFWLKQTTKNYIAVNDATSLITPIVTSFPSHQDSLFLSVLTGSISDCGSRFVFFSQTSQFTQPLAATYFADANVPSYTLQEFTLNIWMLNKSINFHYSIKKNLI